LPVIDVVLSKTKNDARDFGSLYRLWLLVFILQQNTNLPRIGWAPSVFASVNLNLAADLHSNLQIDRQRRHILLIGAASRAGSGGVI
jgi:hypothetical protein